MGLESQQKRVLTTVLFVCCVFALSTPWKINLEHNNGGLEDDFPFQLGDFYVP